MNISACLREIGRGKDGARALDAAQAEDLMNHVLEGRVSEVQLGAFVIAMRIKGETAAELAGFLAAARAHMAPTIVAEVQRSTRPVVWLPSYNGARKLPNLTPLLAGLLCRQGLSVVVHGPAADPLRVTSHAVFQALDWPVVSAPSAAAEIGVAWARGHPVFLTLDALCAPLARLLAVRQQTGLRNSGHTIAKLLSVATQRLSLRVVNHTHPEYAASLAQLLADTRADALLLRGTEGEPVADARRTPRMDVFAGGQRIDALDVAAQGGVLTRVPQLPAAMDAASTARYIESALADVSAVPEPIERQVEAITALARHTARPLEHAA